MLFVDNDQTESMKVHVILKQRMGANDQGRLATRQRLQDLLSRLAFGSTAEPGHRLIEGGQPGVESGEVLLCQQFGRRHEGDLVPGGDRIERRARRHQCLS